MSDVPKPRKSLFMAWPLLLATALAAAMKLYAVVFLKWSEYGKYYPLDVIAVLVPFAALSCVAAWAAGARKGKLALHTVTAILVFAVCCSACRAW